MTALILGLVGAALAALLVPELTGGFKALARRVLGAAALRLPRDRDRWLDEWRADLEARADRPLSALVYAVRVYRSAGSMRLDLLPRAELSAGARRVKRLVDLIAASVFLVVAAPLLLPLVLAIRIESPGPAIYKQMRRGKGGRMVPLLMFRTLRADRHQPDAAAFTHVGRFMRRTTMEELPQVINLLLGHLTLVGPRPLREEAAKLLDQVEPDRPDLTPGMTGPWAFLAARTAKEQVEAEREYVEGWSLWRDIKILCATVPAALMAPRR